MNSPLPTVFNHTSFALGTNCPLFHWILFNKYNYDRLVEAGLIDAIPFRRESTAKTSFKLMVNIIRNYLTVQPTVQQQVDQRRQTFNGQTSIGFHIRKGDKHADFKETRNFLYDRDVLAFPQCVIVQNHTNAVLYVASDSNEAKKMVQKATHHRVIVSSTVARHSHAAMRKEKNVDILMDSFVDLLAVASCDFIVGTWKSSFSVVAGAFRGVTPYFVQPWKRYAIPERIAF